MCFKELEHWICLFYKIVKISVLESTLEKTQWMESKVCIMPNLVAVGVLNVHLNVKILKKMKENHSLLLTELLCSLTRIILCWMLESDWLTHVMRCAIIFRETRGERSSRQISTALQLRITSPNSFSYFKRSYNSNTTKTNKTLAKYINIVSNGIKTTIFLPQNYVLCT